MPLSLLRRARASTSTALIMLAATTLAAGAVVAADVPSATAHDRSFPTMLSQLRNCESGGNYRINTGNGYYGAYQFDLSTWRSVGGSGRPDQASPGTQDALARRLQSERGWAPWPSCSRQLGLRGGGGGDSTPRTSVRASTPQRTERATATRTTPTRTTAKRVSPQRTAVKKVAAPRVQQRSAAHEHHSTASATTRRLNAPAFSAGAVIRQDLDTYRPAVRAWQARMVERGWKLQVDGVYGPESAGIAAAFAREKGIDTARWGDLNKRVFDGAWRLRVTR